MLYRSAETADRSIFGSSQSASPSIGLAVESGNFVRGFTIAAIPSALFWVVVAVLFLA